MDNDATKKIIDRLTESPEVSEESKSFLRGGASSDLQSYILGEESGYKKGHIAGFAKGVGAAAVAVGIAAVGFLKNKKN